jgi:diguanylate cyclase (GGDEF)-like protein
MRDMDEDRAKVLVVEDNRSNIDILLNLLEPYDVLVALDGSGALALLEDELPDVILLDIVMPGMDGYEVCSRIKAQSRLQAIPILFMSARTDEQSLLKAFEVGGSDYVTKPFRARELLARVRTQVEYRRAMEKLRRMAVTDDLTGIHNRRAFFQAATRAFRQATERHEALSALMLDIDHFKGINDRFGHASGDEALKHFAGRVAAMLQPQDLFGRLGGEEFAVLIAGMDSDAVDSLAQRLCEGIRAIRLSGPAASLRMTVSIGVSSLHDGIGDVDALLRDADEQLLLAKRDGRDRVRRRQRRFVAVADTQRD